MIREAAIVLLVALRLGVHATRLETEGRVEGETNVAVSKSLLSLRFATTKATVAKLSIPELDSFPSAPAGTVPDLFVPTVHTCNVSGRIKQFLDKNPEQKERTDKQEHIQKSLVVVHDVLRSLGLPTILEGGSMLGFYRNCDIIPHDKDGDVSLLGDWLKGNASVENMKVAFKKKGGTLVDEMCPQGPEQTGCELRVKFKDNSYIDLFIFATEKTCKKGPCTFYKSLWPLGTIGPSFHPCMAENITFGLALWLDRYFWIPTPTLSYVKQQYGEAWDEPDGGVYRNCKLDENYTAEADEFGRNMPPAEYVLQLTELAEGVVEQKGVTNKKVKLLSQDTEAKSPPTKETRTKQSKKNDKSKASARQPSKPSSTDSDK